MAKKRGEVTKVTISQRAFLARLRRRLRRDGQRLVTSKFDGPYMTVDDNTTMVDCYRMDWDDLQKMAREFGILLPHEVVSKE